MSKLNEQFISQMTYFDEKELPKPTKEQAIKEMREMAKHTQKQLKTIGLHKAVYE